MDSFVKCIHCGKDFKLGEALSHELAEEREKIRKETQEQTRKKLELEFEEKEKEKEKELFLEKKKNQELQESFEKKLEEKFEEKRKEDEARLKRETAEIKEEALKEASDKYRLEKLEWEKQKTDMQKSLEDAQRKAKQGSQQLQGEILELDLENQLGSSFPQDEFLPIPKGVEGADIWQKVINKQGKEVGSILWETKRTKNFDKKWLSKLRDDTRKINASECILVSQVLPDQVKSFHNVEKVWIANYDYALHVARIVRFLLLKIDSVKSATSHEEPELREIFNYITSDAFRHKIEAHEEAVAELKNDLDSEKRLTQIRWKKREVQLNKLDSSVSELYGELQGIMGSALPDIKTLSLPDGNSQQSDSDSYNS